MFLILPFRCILVTHVQTTRTHCWGIKLYDLSKADLFQALLRMVQRCKLESSRITELKARLRLRQNELIQTNNITYQLLELEQANRAQEVFQASLITKIYESRIYKPAVQRQERAIVALENILQALQTQPVSHLLLHEV